MRGLHPSEKKKAEKAVREFRQFLPARICLFAAVVLAGVLSGCGEAETAPEVLIPLTGSVTVDGQPAGGVSLSFVPQEGTSGAGGFATTDDQGQFTVKHRSGDAGIEPGTYKVTMSRMLTPDGNPVPAGESAMDHNATESLPAQYTSADTSPVQTEVTEGMEPVAYEVTTK